MSLVYDALARRCATTAVCERGRSTALILVGGNTPLSFLPNINVSRWSDECFLNINFADITVRNEAEVFANGRVEISVGPITFFAYVPGKNSLLNFGIRLSRAMPKLDELRIPLAYSDNLSFHYQPALTAAEVAEGRKIRPDNVVGSYAIYHAKEGNEYSTGKFGHLYRWQATDALGVTEWCGPLSLVDRTLTIPLPVAWLSDAMYPVTLMGG